MALSVGIVGLPNVGKSTLFNALLKRQQALAANYPFATIEPNVGIVEIPDKRLKKLAQVVEQEENLNSGKIPLKPATIEFYDIAGLVAGASKGEGLGNQFLAHIRETDLICHVLRAFADDDVVLTGKLDPTDDLQTVRTELILKDLETVEKSKKIKARNIKEKQKIEKVLKKLEQVLSEGKMLNTVEFSDEEREIIKPMCLLTTKPELFVINVSDEEIANFDKNNIADKLGVSASDVIIICAKMEAELADFDEIEQKDYLEGYGLNKSGIERMAQAAYKKLQLISFLTVGEIEARAWTVKNGTNAQNAAGVIHTDFAKNFIKAQVIDWLLFIELGGWKKARELGKVRQEGRDYIMKDGDVVEFMIGK
jgi:ribosome-binding ATPase